MRIVSLIPSATEIVYLLGLGDHLTGVSHECDYPAAARGKRRIIRPAFESAGRSSRDIDRQVRTHLERGDGVYRIDLESLQAAEPDLILTQELCDVCAAPHQDVMRAVTTLRRKPEVLSLNPRCLADVLKDVARVGEATGRLREAAAAVAALHNRIEAVATAAAKGAARPRVICLEWLDPLMASGHWVPEMVALAGGTEPLGKRDAPARPVGWEEVVSCRPDILLLMPCGFTVERVLAECHLLTGLPGWDDVPAVRGGRVIAVNGHDYYSRSGPRLVEGLEILARLVHPDLFPDPVPATAAKVLNH